MLGGPNSKRLSRLHADTPLANNPAPLPSNPGEITSMKYLDNCVITTPASKELRVHN